MQFVYFGNDFSAENRTSSHHISRRLAKKFPLLYVEVPGLRTPSASARDLRKVWRRIKKDGALTIRDIADDVLVDKDHPWASRKPSKRTSPERCFRPRE